VEGFVCNKKERNTSKEAVAVDKVSSRYVSTLASIAVMKWYREAVCACVGKLSANANLDCFCVSELSELHNIYSLVICLYCCTVQVFHAVVIQAD
jgi:hypothetical protein